MTKWIIYIQNAYICERKKMKKTTKYSQEDSSISIAEEAAVAYRPTYNLKVILGGKASNLYAADTNTDLDLIQITRKGLKKNSLFFLADYLGISMNQLSDLLHTSYRNLQRKDANEMMDSYKTEKALELATFAQRGTEVIGTTEGFREWIKSPLLSLGNKRPLDFLDTTFGIQLILKVLGRLEQGVYS